MNARPSTLPLFAATLAASLISSTARAQVATAPELPTTARMMALGGNAQAAAQSTSGVFSNPAAMSLSRVYHIDSSVLYDPSFNRWAFGSTIADTTRMVSMAMSYTFTTQDHDTDVHRGHDARLGVSLLLTEGVAIGATARYLNFDGLQSSNTRLGAAYAGFTVDVGAVVRPASFLTLAVTGYSLTNPDTALSPASVGGGIAVAPAEGLNLVVDNVWDLRTFDQPRMRISGGAELLVARIPIRLGYLYDETRFGGPVHTVTGGLGYLDTAFGVEAAIRQDVAGGDQTTLLLNMRYFYRAM